MKYIALLSAVSFESEKIPALLNRVRTKSIAGKTVYLGQLSNVNVLLINTGIGKVNAAHAATAVIENFSVQQVINFGIGGAYPASGLYIGDVAVAAKEIYGDEGVINSGGWSDMKAIGIPFVQTKNKKFFNEFPNLKNPPIPPLLKGGKKGLQKERFEDFVIKSGTFVTVSTATGTHKRAIELEKSFHAICENMEGAAIAHICTIYNIPMLEIRGISNIVGIRDKRKWDIRRASGNCQKVVLESIKYSVALDAYREGLISIGKLSEIFRVDEISTRLYLKKKKIPVRVQEKEELAKDIVNV